MRNKLAAVISSAVLGASALGFAVVASAETVTMVGSITRIRLAQDGKSATAILKESKSGDSVTVTITDDLTLDKFKDKRIVEGDEIRTRFEKKDGKNDSKTFRKTAGC